MATDGPGNFQGDGPVDLFSDITSKLLEEIRSVMESPDGIYIPDGEGIAIPAMDLICTLAERYGGWFIDFEIETIQQWRARYLDAFHKAVARSPGISPEFVQKRLSNLNWTFARFENACVCKGSHGFLTGPQQE